MKSRLLGILSLLVLVLALTACDGSSGSSSSSSSASGAVAAAPLSGALVYDAATNNLVGQTNTKGVIVFNSGSLNTMSFPAVLYSAKGTTPTGASFEGSLEGVMKNATAAVYLTPANTLVAELFKRNKARGLDPQIALTNAQEKIGLIITSEMGLPNTLASNPLDNPIQSERFAKAFMMAMGVSETNTNDMQHFAANVSSIAAQVSNGVLFTKAVNNPEVTESLAKYIASKKDDIDKAAADALNMDLSEFTDVPFNVDESPKTASLLIDVRENSIQIEQPESGYIGHFVVNAFTNEITAAGDPIRSLEPITLVSVNGCKIFSGSSSDTEGTTEVVVGGPLSNQNFDFAKDATFNSFKVAPENATKGNSASFTVTVGTGSEAIFQTYSVSFVGDDALIVDFFEYGDKTIFEFTKDSEKVGKITPNATADTQDTEAWVSVINPMSKAHADGNFDVRFTAPADFIFAGSDSDNEGSYTVREFNDTDGSYGFKASIPANIELKYVGKEDIDPCDMPIGVELLKGNNVERTTSTLVTFIPVGMKDDVIRIDATAKTIDAPATAVDAHFTPSSSVEFKGTFTTWKNEKRQLDDPSLAPIDGAVKAKGNFYLVTRDGAKFFDGTNPSDNIDVQNFVTVTNFGLTLELKDHMTITRPEGRNTDVIQLMYVPNDGETGNIVTSKYGVTIDFNPTK